MRTLLPLLFFCLAAGSFHAQTIAEIQGGVDLSPYDGQAVTTSGIVTAIDGLGYFIQDGTGMWSGIYVYDNTNAPSLGDEITVSGTVDEYYDLTEITSVTEVLINSTGNALPSAEPLATGDVANEGWESVLVQIVQAECTNPDLGFGEFELNDGSGAARIDDLFYLFTASMGVQYGVTGPVYFSFGDYKIVPRGENDVIIAEPLYFTLEPEEFNMTTSSVEIRWETNAPSNSIVEFGLSTQYELGVVADENPVTEHALTIEGLEEATSYNIRVFSENGDDSTPLFEAVVSTTSAFEGSIEVWFNHSVDTSVSSGIDAEVSAYAADSIVSFMASAAHTLDLAIYDLLDVNPVLITAVNAAHAAGVQVRFISDLEAENSALGNLNDEIPVLKGNTDGIMHDKFIIIDAEYPENAKVMTGSMNWTSANLGWDFNNVVVIHDQALARTYTREFNEMWGTDGPDPDSSNAAFGPNKSNNTAHKFIIGGIDVECYFSPSDGTTAQIRERIEAAEDDMVMAVMVFTENSLGSAVANAHSSGVTIRGIIDYVEFNGSEFDYLLDLGINVIDYQNEDGTQWPDGPVLHHKYCVIDYEAGSSTPVVVTGSHNWTASAESINDENTLIIYDASIANQFYQEWTARWNEQTGVFVDELTAARIALYPNPSSGIIYLNMPSKAELFIFDMQGRQVETQWLNQGKQSIDLSSLSRGIYTLSMMIDGKRRFANVMIE